MSNTPQPTSSKRHDVSSNATVFLKYFLPTIWFVFMGSITVFYLLLDAKQQVSSPLSPYATKLLLISFLFSSLGLIYLLFGRIKRVDMDSEFLYVTNYIKTYRYTYESVKSINESNWILFKLMTIQFHQPGAFGQEINFIANYKFMPFLEAHPEVMAKLLGKD